MEVTTQQLEAATPAQRKSVAKKAVQAAEPEEKKDVAAAAMDALSADQRKELIQSLIPQESGHRLMIYVTGFLVAGSVAVALSAIAWQANGDDNSVANGILLLATGFVSAMLGGLLGAYVQGRSS